MRGGVLKTKDNIWKIQNIQRFLKGESTNIELFNIKLFNEEFTTLGEIPLNDFSEIQFKIGDNVIDYYHKKLHADRNLELDAKLLLEG